MQKVCKSDHAFPVYWANVIDQSIANSNCCICLLPEIKMLHFSVCLSVFTSGRRFLYSLFLKSVSQNILLLKFNHGFYKRIIVYCIGVHVCIWWVTKWKHKKQYLCLAIFSGPPSWDHICFFGHTLLWYYHLHVTNWYCITLYVGLNSWRILWWIHIRIYSVLNRSTLYLQFSLFPLEPGAVCHAFYGNCAHSILHRVLHSKQHKVW